jgi:hypothetical protein
MLTWIKAWIGASATSTTGTTLTPPSSSDVGAGKQFPGSGAAEGTAPGAVQMDSFKETVYPLLTQFCSGCHKASSPTAQTPYFATGGTPGVQNCYTAPQPCTDADMETAYQAAQAKIDLNTPANSRFVVRLRDEHHNCWTTATGGAGDCVGSSAAMLAQIQKFADGILVSQVDTTLVLSKALKLKDGTVASGGNRAEANLVAKYEFKTGTGTTAFDTSGVTPAADLQFMGDVSWVGGWGININTGGSAKATTATSAKIASMIQASGEFSIETWVAPANVNQATAWIVSYSGSDKTRNATLGQSALSYSVATRTDKTGANGDVKPLLTTAATFPAQAALQHVVMTFDPTHGEQVYLNGVLATDPTKPADVSGSLASWDNTFALVLGAETTGKEQWLGVIKFVAIHSRALTQDQVTTNYNAGVGEKYFMLFDVTDLSGIPQSYIEVTGSVLDSYAYQFSAPTFISLNPNAAPANLPIKGIRVGVNGIELPSGQSYATVNTTVGGTAYTAAAGQLLSSVGAVVAADKGVDTDMFFLSFDQIGTKTHVRTEPVIAAPVVTYPATPPSQMGVKTFAQVNNALSVITGIPVSNPAVSTLYNTIQQSLPPTNDLAAFLASHQTSIAQLADQYCNIAVTAPPAGSIFSGVALPAVSGFQTPATRALYITPLINRAVGVGVNATTAATIQAELDTLMGTTLKTSTSAAAVAQAACTATLGSAVVSLQ